MKYFKKAEIKFIFLATIIIIALTAGIVNAANLGEDIGKIQQKGKRAIGDTLSLGYSILTNRKDTYCIQYGKTLKIPPKYYTVDKYVEIDGKKATIYNSATDSGKTEKSVYNAILAYIFDQKQGYGTGEPQFGGYYTEAQKAIWCYSNKWTTVLFGENNYYANDNNNSTWSYMTDSSIAKEAKEYATSIGSLTSESENKTLEMEDQTPNKNKLKKTPVGNDYYRVGPFKWKFEGELKSIVVKADGKKVTDVKFVKKAGGGTNTVEVKDIGSEEKFYIDIKGASNISSVHLDLETKAKKDTVITAKVWFLKSIEYQNFIHVTTEKKKIPAEGKGSQDYRIKPEPTKIGLQKVDDRGEDTPLDNVGFKFRAQVQSYDLVDTVEHYAWHTKQRWVPGGYLKPNFDGKGNLISFTWVDTSHYESYKVWELDWIQNIYEWRTHTMYVDSSNMWNTVGQGSAREFKTDSEGNIPITSVWFDKTWATNEWKGDTGKNKYDKYASNPNIVAIESSNPHYGYQNEIGKEYSIKKINETKLLKNHQKYVKLSGYVWLEEHQGKTTLNNNIYDSGIEKGVNDIKVYLKDSSGNTIKTATTSERGLYSEINGGEYQFVDVDLDQLQAGKYHVEFEYGGIKYQSVAANLNKTNGSKAIDTNSRNILDSKFTSVNGNGTQNLDINGVKANYNGTNQHVSTVNNYAGDEVYARTDEAGYHLYSDFEPTMEEIRYINLGLFEKEQADYALTKDLYNVRVEVNGKSHIYRYATVRYNGDSVNDDSSWNLGVKFQRNTGTYSRAIYKADGEFTSSNKDRELKVFATFKIALKNESPYLGRINNIVDYCDSRMKMIHVGTTINDQDVISNELGREQVAYNSDKYSKYKINTNAVINPGETKFIYVQFEMNRDAVLSLINNGELLNNVVEINSYTTFKDNNVNTPVAVVDKDSVPGNIVLGQVNTYEDDTDAATSLKLELKNARAMTGTVFVDSTGKDSNTVYANEERKGNGLFDNGETTLKDVEVKLIDTETNQVTKVYDEASNTFVDAITKTNENGEFEFVGFIPGDYEVVYIWGDKTYKVQYYKGTIYNENRTTVTKGNKYWYRGNTEGYSDDIISADTRATDVLDNYKIREKIDDEMEKVTTNTLEKQISDAYEEGYNPEGKNITVTKMESSTPEMSISVEYPTTITDGTVEQVRFAIRNIDFGIVERPKQQLELSKRVSEYRIALANGQILADIKISEDGKVTGAKTSTIYMGPSANSIGLLKTEMDNELIEGAKLEVTYTITVKNVGEIDYTSDKYYYYGNASGAEKVKVSPAQLLDYVDGRLSVVDDKWEEKDLAGTFATDYNISKKDDAEYLNKIKAYVTEELSKTYLAPNESTKVELKNSKLLTSTDDNEFNNKAEVIETKKNTGFTTGTPVKVTFANQYFNVADSEKITVIPSTGENQDYILPIVIGITAITILGAGIILIKKFVIDKK